MYEDQIAKEIRLGGHVNLVCYMQTLFVMDKVNMKPWERRMMEEIDQLKMIEDDISAIKTLMAE